MRLLPLDFRDQYFGCEIELTGINRATAAQTLADLFGTRAEHSGGGYDAYRVKDLDGKEWKIVQDGSIHPECRRRSVLGIQRPQAQRIHRDGRRPDPDLFQGTR